jgi:hypothetical protein
MSYIELNSSPYFNHNTSTNILSEIPLNYSVSFPGFPQIKITKLQTLPNLLLSSQNSSFLPSTKLVQFSNSFKQQGSNFNKSNVQKKNLFLVFISPKNDDNCINPQISSSSSSSSSFALPVDSSFNISSSQQNTSNFDDNSSDEESNSNDFDFEPGKIKKKSELGENLNNKINEVLDEFKNDGIEDVLQSKNKFVTLQTIIDSYKKVLFF